MVRPHRRTPAPRILLAAIVASIVVGSAMLGALATEGARVANVEARGVLEMSAAERSLATGAGPADGTDWSCSGGSSTQCAAAGSRPLTTPLDARWSNLSATASNTPGLVVAAAGMVWDASDGYVLFWGGGYGTTASNVHGQNNTWTYLAGVWTNVTALVIGHPATNLAPLLAFDPSSNTVVEFGGENPNNQFLNYTWTYHDLVWTNVTGTAGPEPPARVFGAMGEDAADAEVVLFGGDNVSSDLLNDTWTFHDGHWSNLTSTARLPVGDEHVYGYPGIVNDPTLSGALMACAILGGPTNSTEGTYLFAAGEWKNLTTSPATSPPAVVYPQFEWFGQGAAAVLTAGVLINPVGQSTYYPVAWAYFGGTWVNLTSPSVYGTAYLGEGASTPDGALFYFGGAATNYAAFGFSYVFAFPATVNLSAAPAATDVGQPVGYIVSVTHGVAPVTGTLEFGDGHSTAITGGGATHTFDAPGTFQANISSTDLAGTSASASANVTVNPVPSVTTLVASTTNTTPGSNVDLTATLAGGTAPFTYAWSFGDGTTSDAIAPSHSWTSAGTYSVTLTVTDAVGAQASKTVEVTVAASGNSSASLTSGTGLYLLLALVAAIVVIAALAVLLLRKRSPPGPPTPYPASPAPQGAPAAWTPPPSAPPPGAT
jgi:PKD domain